MPRNVSLYGPSRGVLGGSPIQRDYMTDPRRMMAQQLMQQGSSTAPVQSPLEGLTRALTAGVGGYFGNQAQEEMQGREGALNEDMLKVLAGAQQTPQPLPQGVQGPPAMSPGGYEGMTQALGGIDNPDIAPFAQQLGMQQMQQQQAVKLAEAQRGQKMDDFEEQLKLKQKYPGAVTGRPAANIQYGAKINSLRENLAEAEKAGDPAAINSATQQLEDFQYVMSKDPDALRKQAYSKGKGAGEADIEVAAPKAESTATGKAIGVANMALYDTVQSGIATVEKADDLIKHLNSSGAITGAGAEVFKGVERLKALMGSDIAAGNVADTEILNAMMGSDVFGMIKSLGIGARGLDTPAEREFMREVLTGTISLNKETIIKLAEIRRDVGQRAIDKWNDKTERGELDRFYEATGLEKAPLGLPKSGGGPSIPGPAPAQNPEDQAAMEWATANPNDPRAAQILKLHGGHNAI